MHLFPFSMSSIYVYSFVMDHPCSSIHLSYYFILYPFDCLLISFLVRDILYLCRKV